MKIQRYFLVLLFCSTIISTCRKPQKEMMVSTGTIPTITSMTSVTIDGNIIDLGEGAIQYGHCYGKTSGVDIKTDSVTKKGVPTSTIKFTSELKNLEVGKTYYVKAYISDGIKPVYGSEISFTLCTPPSVPAVGAITQPTCSVSTGSVALSGLPAPGTWTLTRTPGGTTTTGTGTSTTISGLEAGTYTFTVTNASSCVSAASGNITINTQPASPSAPVVGAITQPTCSVATGSVALSGLPATGTWTLKSTPGGTTTTGTGTTKIVSGLPAGATYTFTVTNASGCVSAASGNVAINTQLGSPSAPVVGTITQPTCTVATGSVALSGLPATGTWTLTRTPGGTTTTGTGTSTTVSGLAAGTYTFTVTNASGCVSAASGNVAINTQPATPSAPVAGTITQPTCSAATGSVALSGLPGSGTWTLTRTPGGTTTTGTGTSTTVSGLPAGTTYTFTVKNAAGCVSAASGNVAIGAQPASPSATTGSATNIGANTVTLNGTVNANGYSATVTFEYGTTTSYGTTVTATQSPVSGSSNTAVSAVISGLISSTLYYYRVKAVNCGEPINGDRLSFTTSFSCGDLLTDPRDGKTYHTVQIGNQCWFAENINIGTRINGLDNQTDNAVIEKYCYDDNESNCNIYGGLYQWDEMMQYTTNESSRGVCPIGWHVPSDNEWKTLEMTLGMDQTTADATGWRGNDEGGKLKAVSNLWNGENVGATNTSHFTALPSGNRNSGKYYNSIGFFTDFWTSTFDTGTQGIWYRLLQIDHAQIQRVQGIREFGTPLRCVKD
jgi:uncharacterized protein (TIGR02145 family)